MSVKRFWYVMDPDDGLTAYDTASAAQSACRSAMDSFADNADDGWPEGMGTLEWGELVPASVATCTASRPAPDGSDFDTIETWELSMPPRSWSFTVDGIATKRGPAPGASGRKGHLHASAATVGYEQRIAGAAIDAGLAAGVGPCSVHVVVWLPDRHARDDDRIKCAVNDGLKRAGKAALADDSMLVIQDSRVTLGGIDRRRPRLEITVTLLDTDRSL